MFHLFRAFDRNIKEKHLQTLRTKCPEFAHAVRLLQSLAFLPPSKVLDGFDIFLKYLEDKKKIFKSVDPASLEHILTLVEYLERMYIGTDTALPVYDHKEWVKHAETLEGIPRTNNVSESFNSIWNKDTCKCNFCCKLILNLNFLH